MTSPRELGSRYLENPVDSLTRSARDWQSADPEFAKRLRILALSHGALMARAEGKWVITFGGDVLDEAFEDSASAVYYAQHRASGQFGVVFQVTPEGLSPNEFYTKTDPDAAVGLRRRTARRVIPKNKVYVATPNPRSLPHVKLSSY